MTLRISKNPSHFKKNSITLPILAALAVFFTGVLLSRASDNQTSSKQITRKKPVSISSSRLTFDKLKGLTLFKGKVKALHGTVVLTADEIRAFSENNAATAKGHVKVVDKSESVTLTCGNLEYQDLMETMTAHDHPILTSVDNDKKLVTISGRQMELDSDAKTVVVNQNVQIVQAESSAEAQKATFFARDNKLILEDDPRVYTSSAQISARRITTNLGAEKSFFAEGLADAVFNPSGEPLTTKSSNDEMNRDSTGKKGKTANRPVSSQTPGVQPTALATPGAGPDSLNLPTVVPSVGVSGRQPGN